MRVSRESNPGLPNHCPARYLYATVAGYKAGKRHRGITRLQHRCVCNFTTVGMYTYLKKYRDCQKGIRHREKVHVCSSKISEIIHPIYKDFFQNVHFFYSNIITPFISGQEKHLLITIYNNRYFWNNFNILYLNAQNSTSINIHLCIIVTMFWIN